MIYSRIADPPEHLEKEAEELANAFFEQFDNDDIIPDGAYGKYLREHGSDELVNYLNTMARIRATEESE